ncbi:LysR family transcriptional regulator [Paramesorhizobium deserti]|nr:LysR family transcriptional regulator [Paramesorhizobium deserti]
MLPNALRYFLEVARTGSINGASQRLHVAGSAISRQIAALEMQFETPLFERKPRGMVLTPAGEKLADYTRRALLDAEDVAIEIKGEAEQPRGTIRLAISEGLANSFMSEMIFLYRQKYPEIRFDVHVVTPPNIAVMVREGEVDIGIAFAIGAVTPVHAVRRVRVATVALMHPSHPLTAYDRLAMRDLAPYPVALSAPDTTLRKVVDLRCAAEGVSLRVAMVSSHSAGLMHFARLGGGIAFASPISARTWISDGLLVARPFKEDNAFDRSLEIQTMAARRLPPLVNDFSHFLAEQIGERTKI